MAQARLNFFTGCIWPAAHSSLTPKLEHAFNHFPKYHMKILFGAFSVIIIIVGREDIFN
jgi:hypothetical protein